MGTEHRDHHHHHHRDGGGGGGGGKPGLLTWWQKHTAQKQPRQTSAAALAQAHKGFDYVPPPPGIVFGRPLKESLKFANVQVSTADTSGQLYVWGHIPVVVAKWYVLILVLPPLFISTPPFPPLSLRFPTFPPFSLSLSKTEMC